jgi:hypothetical protein
MAKLVDLSNKKFGSLFVLGISHRRIQPCGASILYWAVRCDCGKIFSRKTHYLTSSRYKNKSCGCLIPKLTSARFKIHGMKNHPLYNIWKGMVSRCTNPKSKDWRLYGARGISICKEWLNIDSFIKDMGERPSKKHSLDRVDNNRGYNKDNCRWAIPKEQANNKRNNRKFLLNGESLTLSNISLKYGINIATLHRRLSLGEPIETAHVKGDRRYLGGTFR